MVAVGASHRWPPRKVLKSDETPCDCTLDVLSGITNPSISLNGFVVVSKPLPGREQRVCYREEKQLNSKRLLRARLELNA